jgi:2-amino-4-hydroxy-6-hydroxymethyldihydropteridine diphosphokinase
MKQRPGALTDQPSFYNQALAVETTLEPEELMQQLLHIEEKMGRQRTIKMGPRIIDLDILLIDDWLFRAGY